MYNIVFLLFLIFLVNEYQVYRSCKYVALGDSLAAGTGAFWGCGYTRLYYGWLISCANPMPLAYCNLGVMGWTSEDLLCAVRYNNGFKNAIARSYVLTVDIGGNDMLKHKYSQDMLHQALECFKQNLHNMLYEIRCLNDHAKIYIMDIYNPYPSGHALHETGELWVSQFNAVIWNTLMVPEYKVSGVAGVYAAFKGNECAYTLIEYGNIHPNTLGHKIISECFQSITV